MSNKIYTTALLSITGVLMAGCQGEQNGSRGRRHATVGSGEYAAVDFEAANSQSAGNALGLADGDTVAPVAAYKISVACDDVTPLDVDSTPFDLPLNAKNCIAKLRSIKIGEKNYIEGAEGTGFTNYAVDEIGQFVNEKDPNDKLFVRVRKQLPSPLTADVSVQYDYSNIKSFETIEGTREGLENTLRTNGDTAPAIKVTAAKLQSTELTLTVVCTDAAGFTSSSLADMKCAGTNVGAMKFSVGLRTDDSTPNATELKQVISTGKLVKDLKPEVVTADKSLKIQIPSVKDSAYFLFVASNGDAYTYGFIKMGGVTTANAPDCKNNDASIKFSLLETDAVTGIGNWVDTGNCNVWTRKSLEKVVAKKRFSLCPGGRIALPYGSDMKAAYEKGIKDLAFGAAPKIPDQNTTFWLAGGRVFDMATGKLREIKDIKPDEQHSVLCLKKGN